VAGVEVLGDDLFGDFGGFDFAFLHFGGDGASGFDDFGAAAVAEREDQRHAGVFGEGGLGLGELFLDEFGEAIDLADDFEADVVFVHLGYFGFQVAGEILHERIDFVFGAVPVFDGEGVESEVFDAEFAAGAEDGADTFDAGAMSFHARELTLLGPAPVAIHDDGEVGREVLPGLRT
jgi:hypothetical protein